MHNPPPPPQQFRAFPAKSAPFCPHLPSPCQTRSAPAAGWIANVSSQVGGNAPVAASRRRARRSGRRWPTWFRWRAVFFREHRAKPATGPGSCSSSPSKADRAGQRCGPVADMLAFCRQGPCRNHAQSSSRGPSRPRPGQPGRQGPEEGQVKSQPPRACEASACRMGTPSGGFRAARCQRHPIPTYPRHCLRAALRTQVSFTPRRRCRAGSFRLSEWRCGEICYCASKSSTSLSVSGRAWQESVKPASISQGSSEKFSSMVAAPSTILQRQVQHMPPAQE